MLEAAAGLVGSGSSGTLVEVERVLQFSAMRASKMTKMAESAEMAQMP